MLYLHVLQAVDCQHPTWQLEEQLHWPSWALDLQEPNPTMPHQLSQPQVAAAVAVAAAASLRAAQRVKILISSQSHLQVRLKSQMPHPMFEVECELRLLCVVCVPQEPMA